MINLRSWLLPLLAVILGLPLTAVSQVSDYSFSNSLGSYDTIVGGTSVPSAIGDTEYTGGIPIGFVFNFNGINYDSVYVSSNGFLSFNENLNSATSNNLENGSASIMPLVAPLWDDLAGSSSSNSDALYEVSGTAPNRVFTFEWKRWEWNYSASDPVISFQVKLYESTNVVEFVYAEEAEPVNGTVSASIGLADGNTFLSVQDVANPSVSSTNEADTLTQKPVTGTIYSFTPPSCLSPAGLQANFIGSDSVILGWSGLAASFEFEYDTAGFVQGTGVTGVSNTDSLIINGLSTSTEYDFYVRSICGVGDTSNWVGPFSFSTYFQLAQGVTCGLLYQSPVFSEEFDAQGGWTGDFGTGNGTWHFNSGSTTSGSTGPSGAHSGSNYIYFEATGGSGTGFPYDTAVIYSPAIDLTTASGAAELSFWIHAYGSTMGTLNVGVSTSLTGPFTNVLTINGDYQTASSDPWLNPGADLSSYIGQTIYLQFHFVSGSNYYSDFAIDLLEVNSCVSCPTPDSLAVISVDSNNAEITWTTQTNGSTWFYQNVPAGTAPSGNGTMVMNDTITISGLTPVTTYDFYVREECGQGNNSTWAGPISYTTSCATYTATHEENFDGVASLDLPLCWSVLRSAGVTTSATVYAYTNTNSVSSPNYFRMYNSSFDDPTDYIIAVSPEYSDLASNANRVRFNMYNTNSGLIVGTMSNPSDSSTFVAVDTIPSGIGSMTEFIVDLDNVPAGHRYVAFRHGVETTYDYIYIDDYKYEAIPSCLKPTAPVVLNTTDNSATLSWTPGQGETEWVIEYDTAGFVQGTGNYLVVTNDTSVITGLSSSTSYEFYVRAVCTAGDSSYWTTTSATAVTLCGTIYPTPYLETFDGTDWVSGSGTDNSGDQIDLCWLRNPDSGFFFGTRSGTTGSSSTGPSGDNTTGSGNYVYTEGTNGSSGDTASISSPRIDLNGVNNPMLNFAYHMYGSSIQTLYIEIDNGNGWVVLDSIVGSQQSSSSDSWGNKEVPLLTYSSDTVQLRWVTEKGSSFYNDLAIDDVEIYNATGDDLSAIAFLQPASLCGDSNMPVQVIVQNLGVNPQTGFDVVVDWTGSTTGSISTIYTGTLAWNEIDTITVDTLNTYFGGSFNLSAYTTLVGDEDVNNDTVVSGVITILPGLNAPSVVGGSSQTVCYDAQVDFVANGSGDTTLWYNSTGNLISLGDTFSITANQDDTLYATTANVFGQDSLGLVSNIGTSGFISQATGWGLGFTVHTPTLISSVVVYPQGTGTIEIEISDQATNNIFYVGPTTNVSGPSSLSTGPIVANEVPVNAFLLPGTYKIGMSSTGISSLIRDSGAGGFPYSDASGNIEITGGSSGTGAPTSTSYYWFYNWKTVSLGCESSASMVTYAVDSVAVDLGADTAYCADDVFAISLDAANTGSTYAWNTAETTQTISVDTAGSYSVEVTNTNGCVATDTLVITENALPVVDLGADTGYCVGDAITITLDAANVGSTYAWNTTETTQTISVDTAGSYSVVVTDANGCVNTDTVAVDENTLPTVELGADTAYCSDEAFALTLDAANAGSSFSWNTTETTQTISVDTAGSYSVVVTDVNGCSETDTLTVVENEAPSISIADAEFCEGDSETLDAGSGFASYAWSSTETTQTIVVDASGTYEVTVTDANGCTGEATSTVVVNPLPVVDLGADTGVSPGQVIVLDAGNAGSTYNWNTGETTQTIDVEYADSPAEFSVVVTDANGCSAGDTIYVDQNTGIDELVNGSVKVYPNPTRSNATIAIDAVVSGELDVQMYSLTGQQIRNFKQDIYTGYQEVNVDMNNLESGVYFINATLNGKSLGQIRVLKVD